jgi:hypothetical protein
MANLKNAGGTDGGGEHFFLGVALAAVGAYLLTSRVTVSSGYWGYHGFYGFGEPSFGMALIPFMLGVGLLFANGKSIFGWALTVAGVAIVLAAIVMNLHIFFRPTSLYETMGMLAMLAAGMGLVAKSLVRYANSNPST